MRVAYVTETYPPEVNGVSLNVARTVNHLRQEGHSVDLIRPRQRGDVMQPRADEWLTAGCAIPMYPDLRFGLAFPSTMRRRLKVTQAELVHVATPGPLGHIAARAAKSLGLPLTVDFRTNFHRYSHYYGLGWGEPLIKRIMKSLHDLADLSFVPTQSLKSALSSEGYERLEVVGRGVDALRYSPQWRCDRQRSAWGASPHTPVMIYVGRLAAEKQVDLALQAWMRTRSVCPHAIMVVVGDGPHARDVRKRWPNVIFTGMLSGDALARAYASADLFLFPSESETFGNVVLEAMASGLCVVAFKDAAAQELIRNGQNGFVVPKGDREGFCKAAADAAAHLAFMGRLREQARHRACMHDWSSTLWMQSQRMAELVDAVGDRHVRATCVA